MSKRFRFYWRNGDITGNGVKNLEDMRAEVRRIPDLFAAACVAVNYWNLGGGPWQYWIDPNDYVGTE